MSQQWHNQNEFRKYPFREEATMVATDGATVPNQLVADLQCTVPSPAAELYLWKAYVTQSTVSVMLAMAGVPVLACTVGTAYLVSWKAYPMVSLDGVSSGQIVFGDVSNLAPLAIACSGYSAAGVEPRCVRSWKPSVLSIGRRYDPYVATGVVSLVPGTSMSLSTSVEGCYHVLNSSCTGYPGLYLPSGTLSSRPIYVRTDGLRRLYYEAAQWKLGLVSSTDADYYTADSYPDRPQWVRVSDGLPFDPQVVRSSLVDVGLAPVTMPEFLGPYDRQSIAGACGSPVLRSLGGASTDGGGHINIIAVASPE